LLLYKSLEVVETVMVIFNSINDREVVNMISNGAIGVIPTDTLLGLACVANNQESVSRLYELKSRDKKPGTIIASSVAQLVDLGIKRRYLKAVENYWPAPVSVVIPCGFKLGYLHQGLGTLAVRVVEDTKLAQMLNATGPLLTSSANLPGQPEARNMEQAIDYFGENVDFYVDYTISEKQLPSTVIRVIDDAVEVLREGAVNINEETGDIIK
jgi:L-threonylcarbamoyladenylate synthase